MYFVEIGKKLKVAVAVVAISVLSAYPQISFAESPSPITREALNARLEKIRTKRNEINALEIQFRAWMEETKPPEGGSPTEQHQKIVSDHAEVLKQLGNMDNVIGFLNRKISENLNPAELEIAEGFLTKVEHAVEALTLPQPPVGSPTGIIATAPVARIETSPLPPIETTRVEEEEEKPEEVVKPVEEEKPEPVDPVETTRRARIAAETERRLALLNSVDEGIPPIVALPRGQRAPERVAPAPVVEERRETSPAPVVVERREVPTVNVERQELNIVTPERNDFSVTLSVPREDGSERVVAKTNLGEGYDPQKVQYVELNCSNALVVRRDPNGASRNIDDVSCKNEKGDNTKVLILGYQDGYYKIFVNGNLGWISAVKTGDPKEVGIVDEEDTTVAVTPQDGQLRCDTRLMHRGGPSTSYRILQKIPCKTNGRPTPVKVIGKHNETGWYLVSHNGTIAWSSNRYITTSEPDDLQVVTDELIQGLSKVPDLGNLGIKCDPNRVENDDPNCMNFQADLYSKSDSGRQIANSINRAKQRGTRAKKARFFELFAPLAVYIQTKTGWPASVALAQMAIETGWGTSNVFRSLNNFGGHSCTRYNANGSNGLRNPQIVEAAQDPNLNLQGLFRGSRGDLRVKTPCTYPRGESERYYYRTFPSVTDGALLYADNVLESGYYPEAARHVKTRFANGEKADPRTVVQGLRAYAKATDYRDQLMGLIRSNDLTRFDSLKTCPLSARD